LETDKKKLCVQQVVDKQLKAYELITTAIQEQQDRRQFSGIQKAIQLLQKQYKTRLSLDGFNSAVEVLEQKGKATVFITLSSDAYNR
jgi:YesN/AraC family two-component response regulator